MPEGSAPEDRPLASRCARKRGEVPETDPSSLFRPDGFRTFAFDAPAVSVRGCPTGNERFEGASVCIGRGLYFELPGPAVEDSLDEARPTAATPESTTLLLRRARSGDARAYETLHARYAPRLQRWARGRMPESVRDGMETVDLVQDAFAQLFRHIDQFVPRWKGAMHAYLRRVVLNRIRDQIRRAEVRDRAVEEAGILLASEPSPLAYAIGREALERYEVALSKLPELDREAVVARLEMDCSYEEIADVLGKPSPDAARMTVKRALVRLARDMEGIRDVEA
jgi:RNA polymerase sigma factor (sigma-70 family)